MGDLCPLMSLVMPPPAAIRTFASVIGPQRRKLSETEVDEIKLVKLPVVKYPQPVSRCKYTKTAVSKSNEWVRNLPGMYRSRQVMQKHVDQDLSEFLMATFVEAGEKEALLVSKWMMWAFAIDDYFDPDDCYFDRDVAYDVLCDMNMLVMWCFLDDPHFRQNLEENLAGEDPVKRQAILGRIDMKLTVAGQYPGTVYDSSTDHPLVRGLENIWKELAESTPRQYLLRWSISVQRYINSFFKEVHIRTQDYVPLLHDYVLLRRETFAGPCMLMFCEYCERHFLPTEVIDTPEMKRLVDTGSDCAAWINDLASLKKEAVTGDVYNLVIIIYREQKCSYQEAVERAWQMFFNRMEDLERDYEAAKTGTAPTYHDGLEMYMKNCKNFVWGGHDWLVSNNRYKV
nr:terpene synthase [Radula lindenbergiana]